jgi:hypothetical protein
MTLMLALLAVNPVRDLMVLMLALMAVLLIWLPDNCDSYRRSLMAKAALIAVSVALMAATLALRP